MLLYFYVEKERQFICKDFIFMLNKDEICLQNLCICNKKEG